MRLTQATDYALRVVLAMAGLEPGDVVTAKTLSESENIPMRFLLRILGSLAKAGIVESYRGKGGGYALARPPDEINLLDVVEAVEGPIRINRCLIDPEYCTKHWANRCPVHDALRSIQDSLVEQLRSYNFADLRSRVRN